MIFYWLLGLTLLLSSTSSSSTNYNPNHYDSMRHFTPDGRLLQVEYAMKASEHSSPVVVCKLDEDTLALLCLSPTNSKRARPQDRMVVLDDGAAVVVMSGVLSDNLALLRHAHNQWLDWKYLFGSENASPRVLLHMFSTEIAQECHWNSFQRGIRPFGASFLLVAVVDESFRICQTNPSGSILEIINTHKDNYDDRSLQLWTILGGGETECRKIEKAIQKWNENPKIQLLELKSTVVWQKLKTLTRILLDATQEDPASGSFFQRKSKQAKQEETKPQTQHQLEVILVSRKMGIHRLKKADIQRLLELE